MWQRFAPAILGTLLVLWIVQLPLAWRVARRLQEGQAERETLLRSAIESSELERRRIARDLHDGAVQDLAGVSYSLAATADSIDGASRDELEAALREGAGGTRRTIRELRTLLVDIYPPDLHRTGLDAALRDLVAPLGARGIEASVDVAGRTPARGGRDAALPLRAGGLRNVVLHSKASHVDVGVELEDGLARLTVADDGEGFELPARGGPLRAAAARRPRT